MAWRHTEETKRKITANRVTARGEHHGQSVLNNESVLELVDLRNAGGATIGALANMFSVSEGTVKAVLYGWTWSHVTGINGTPRKQKARC
jgi:hypothetical protein